MGLSLAEALGQVDLEAGQVYRCEVKGRWVELRVLEPPKSRPSHFDGSDVMLDPWVEFPLPAPSVTIAGEIGPPPPLDVPEMPSDEVAR